MAASPLSRLRSSHAALVAILCALAACARTPLALPPEDDAGTGPGVERCNQLDDDHDLQVDEDYRDPAGHYVDAEHCGACDRACDAPIANAEQVGCALLQGIPNCVAVRCAPGFGPTRAGGCAPLDAQLCLPCLDDADCGTLAAARCEDIAGERRCTRDCGTGCPAGYACAAGEHCVPIARSCICQSTAEDFTLACQLVGGAADCPGSARCENGVQSPCRAPEEICDGLDNDCDLEVDEVFVDALGAYSRDPAHCGACGVDCGVDRAAGVALVCGGDPFAPSCVSDCPDAADGIQPGDLLDADRVLTNGCECTVRALLDASGDAAGDAQLDANCDGADGSVLSSFYVATSGDDGAPGSPTRPLRSIDVAVQRANNSLRSAQPRPHVYVASGIYTETVHVRDGVSLHGGYRSDFLALNPDGFEVIVVAPADTGALAGAALVIEDVGAHETVVEGLTLRGRDALAPGAAALGVLIARARSGLVLRNLRVRAGHPGAGENGSDGAAGQAPLTAAEAGPPPRAAVESALHECVAGPANRVSGGRGASHRCDGSDVSGGSGGSPVCPSFGALAAGGENGRGAQGVGSGGLGGHDVAGPIGSGPSCPSAVCCGLADFSVPNPFQQAQPGTPGADGVFGSGGIGCSDPIGSFGSAAFVPGLAYAGARAAHGNGGGGGGGGGGAELQWVDASCEFADGLGGGGGGGGAGGCGGWGGAAGGSGAPSIGILIRARSLEELPVLEAIELTTSDGARGGDGGAGGDGAPGSQGGFGGSVAEALRSTPTLAGPMAGERGGKGGDGGGGGGGGGGCGGSSIGIWVTGLGDQPGLRDRFQAGQVFALGAAGQPGRGGGGVRSGADGAPGQRAEVVAR